MTVKKRLQEFDKKWDSMDKWLKRVISLVGSLGVICAGATTFFNNGINQIEDRVSEQIAPLKQDIAVIMDETESTQLDTLRIQLMFMIETQPEQTDTILRIAYKYFVEKHGDWVMTDIFNKWKEKYNIQVPFTVQ